MFAYKHACTDTYIHTYIKIKHFSLETYIILEWNICTIFRVVCFQNFRFPEFPYFWKYGNLIILEIKKLAITFYCFLCNYSLFYTSVLYNSPLGTAKSLAESAQVPWIYFLSEGYFSFFFFGKLALLIGRYLISSFSPHSVKLKFGAATLCVISDWNSKDMELLLHWI